MAADWSKIVPEILDEAPKDLFEVRYPTFDIKLGQEVKPVDLAQPPAFVNWPNIDHDSMYTMVLIDCDPNDAADYEYKQLNMGMSVNMPGGYVTQGFITAPYTAPMPKTGTGFHRYLVTVYKQSAPLRSVPFAYDEYTRHNFDLRKFVKEFNLGSPVAGLYFLAEADEFSQHYWDMSHQFSFKTSGSIEKSGSFQCSIQ